MTVIRPNSISGITSITAQANEINIFRSNGTIAGLNLNGVNFNTTTGVSTFNNLDVGGVLTYQDVTNVDSLGIGTFRTGINVSGGQLDVGNNIKLGNAGVITATSFVGSGANLTSLPAQATIANNADNRVITGGSGVNLNGESNLTFNGGQLFTQTTGNQDPLVVNSTYANKKLVITETSDANSNGGIRIQKKHSSLHPANYWYGDIAFQGWDGSGYHRAGLIECVADGTPANDNMPGMLRFSTNSGAASQTERFRITASGQLRLMEGNSVRMSVYNSGGLNFITSNSGEEIKVSCGNGSTNGIEFWDYTGTDKRCQIDGHGIKFNTDTAQANALNDYEEGTFTPAFSNGLVASGYAIQKGVYTKIGRYVFGTIILDLSTTSSQTTSVIDISGLPFTTGNYHTIDGESGGAHYNYQDGFYNANGFTGIVVSNNTIIRLYRADNGDFLTGTSVNGGRQIRMNFSYHAA